INNAINSKALVVCASGNSSNNSKSTLYPSKYSQQSGVISVGAIDIGRNKFKQTMEKGNISIYCPGVDIISCDKDGNYTPQSGTSQATPYLAGVASLVLAYSRSKNKNLTPIQIGQIILDS